MNTQYLRTALAVLACSAALSVASPSFAAMVAMKAVMTATSEVPATMSKGSGTLTATYDTESRKLTWKGDYTGLSGPATAAHFHTGEVGANGDVAVPIAAKSSPFEGTATLTEAQAVELMDGKWYVNIHTEANKAGEIRGNVTK